MTPNLPLLDRRFDLALQLASGLHHTQTRKGTSTPFIAHLMGVCALVLESGGDEDQAIAALLHDAVEDQGGLPTLATIISLFGQRVGNIVEACSDSTSSEPTQKLPWRERKESYLRHLHTADADTLLVSAADKLHNLRTMLLDYRDVGEHLWSRFNAGKDEQLWYYASLNAIFESRDVAPRLVSEMTRTLKEIKSSLLDVTR